MKKLLLTILALAVAASAARAEQITIPVDVIKAALRDLPECDEEVADEPREADDLGNGQRLVQVQCWRAAYQFGYVLFAVDPKAPEKARLLRFQNWNGKTFDWSNSLTDPDFDADKKTLTMRHKGRGIGDCGVVGEWKWTGADFKLTGFWNKPKCDGRDFEPTQRWRIFPKRG